jgi:long-chain acyl-CoA synthetase
MMLYNNQNKYTTALVIPNKEAILRWARNHGIELCEPKGLEAVLIEIDMEINHYKQGGRFEELFPSRWLPAAIAIIAEPFTVDNGLLNSTGKMVRSKIVEFHQDKISFLYTPEAKDILNQSNLDAIARVFCSQPVQ